MNQESPSPAPASRRPGRLTTRRSNLVAALLATIIGVPIAVSAVADNAGAGAPTGSTLVPDEAPADTPSAPASTLPEPSATPSAVLPTAEAAAEETAAPADEDPDADAGPPLDLHALLTDPYAWEEQSLRVAALQQVLHLEVDGSYDADTRTTHLEFLEFLALSTEGVPDVAPPGPSAEAWAALRDCESGGDYSIVSSTGRYRGAYQFLQSTWDSVADRNYPSLVGVDPATASAPEQDAMALALYREEGASPWPVCGRALR